MHSMEMTAEGTESERAELERRLTEYRRLADEQIQQMLATMMSISMLVAKQDTDDQLSGSEVSHGDESVEQVGTKQDSQLVTERDSEQLFLLAHQRHLQDAIVPEQVDSSRLTVNSTFKANKEEQQLYQSHRVLVGDINDLYTKEELEASKLKNSISRTTFL